jgi:hypothetical protein
LARIAGKANSVMNGSIRSPTIDWLAPESSAFWRIGSSSSPWPRSAAKVITSSTPHSFIR